MPARTKRIIGVLWLAAGVALVAGLPVPVSVSVPALADDESAATPAQMKAWTGKWGGLGPVYDLAVRFTGNGRHGDAITLLLALKRSDNPRVLNYLGFNTRKLGRAGEAVFYYEKAIAIAPEFTLAREYLGEAYLMTGQPDKAREQLAAIGKLCGTSCEPYRDLAGEIARQGGGK